MPLIVHETARGFYHFPQYAPNSITTSTIILLNRMAQWKNHCSKGNNNSAFFFNCFYNLLKVISVASFCQNTTHNITKIQVKTKTKTLATHSTFAWSLIYNISLNYLMHILPKLMHLQLILI
jgi:hypothetical protein